MKEVMKGTALGLAAAFGLTGCVSDQEAHLGTIADAVQGSDTANEAHAAVRDATSNMPMITVNGADWVIKDTADRQGASTDDVLVGIVRERVSELASIDDDPRKYAGAMCGVALRQIGAGKRDGIEWELVVDAFEQDRRFQNQKELSKRTSKNLADACLNLLEYTIRGDEDGDKGSWTEGAHGIILPDNTGAPFWAKLW